MFVVNTDSFFMSHRLPIALAAVEQGYEVHVATSLTDCDAKMRALGLIVHPLSLCRRSMNIFSNGRVFFQILRIFISVKPDIVHLVTIKPVLMGGIAARLASVSSVVVAISGMGFVFISQGFKARIRRLIVGQLYRLIFDRQGLIVIFQNEDDQASLIKLGQLSKEKTRLIRGSGVDLARYPLAPLPQGPPIVMLAARLLVDKGVREFVQAARILKNNGSAARFVLVGEPDPGNPATVSDNELQHWVSEGVIQWWGLRNDIPQVFAASTLVVLPSYREGLPKVLVEAAACGRAVITTDVPGCRDAIEPNLTGLLVPVRDSQSLADAIKQLLDNPLLCEHMGQAGRKLAERSFDVREIVEQHIHIYDELLQGVD